MSDKEKLEKSDKEKLEKSDKVDKALTCFFYLLGASFAIITLLEIIKLFICVPIA